MKKFVVVLLGLILMSVAQAQDLSRLTCSGEKDGKIIHVGYDSERNNFHYTLSDSKRTNLWITRWKEVGNTHLVLGRTGNRTDGFRLDLFAFDSKKLGYNSRLKLSKNHKPFAEYQLNCGFQE